MTNLTKKEIKAMIDESVLSAKQSFSVEVKHHMGALLEAFEDKLRVVIDMVKGLVDKTDEMQKDIARINETLLNKADQKTISNHEERITRLEKFT